MLEIIDYDKDEYSFPCLLVLGCFDAIHEGHRELFKKAKLQAKINGLDLGVMMFSCGKGGKQVFTLQERIKFLETYNVKFIMKVDFTDEFKQTKPLDFLAKIESKINVKAYMSGKDFRFGAGAKGKSSTLKNYAEDEENGVWYMPVKDVLSDGEKISTTLIKACLEEGNIAKANRLLGTNFFVTGKVIHGQDRGNSLGYPTVNIEYPADKYEVKQGVYKVQSVIGEKKYFGIANYGPRPTFGEEVAVLEVHYIGFDGDLYGEELKVEFLDYIRDIKCFDSAAQLTAQLQCDKAFVLGEDIAEDVIVEEITLSAEEALSEQEKIEYATEVDATQDEENKASAEATVENNIEMEAAAQECEAETEESTNGDLIEESAAEAAELHEEESSEESVVETTDTADTEEKNATAEESESEAEIVVSKEVEEPVEEEADETVIEEIAEVIQVDDVEADSVEEAAEVDADKIAEEATEITEETAQEDAVCEETTEPVTEETAEKSESDAEIAVPEGTEEPTEEEVTELAEDTDQPELIIDEEENGSAESYTEELRDEATDSDE